MKLKIMRRKLEAQAFTLIEMIGVLAVLAILAALLIPKVFSAIDSARINNTAASIETIKTATADHYGKFGVLTALYGTNNLPLTISDYVGSILMPEQLVDKPFAVKIGTNAFIQVIAGSTTAGGSGGYALDGGLNSTTSNATAVVEAVIQGVAQQDAADLNNIIDGQALGAAVGSPDSKGRVEFSASSPTTTVYVYITSR